jgi:biotin operon repressor
LTVIKSDDIDAGMLEPAPIDAVVRLFKGLADPTRLRLVAAMVDRPRCGQDLAAEAGISAGTVSHHLKVLGNAGLLVETRTPPYTFFQLDLQARQRALQAVSTPKRVRELATVAEVDDGARDILRAFFDGPRLRSVPVQRRKREVVLDEVLRRLPRRREYKEADLNRFIEVMHPDFCTIRRELVTGGWMERSAGIYRVAERGRTALET